MPLLRRRLRVLVLLMVLMVVELVKVMMQMVEMVGATDDDCCSKMGGFKRARGLSSTSSALG